MPESPTRGGTCENCNTLMEMMKGLSNKMDQINDYWKKENDLLKKQLSAVNNKYLQVNEKLTVVLGQINNIRQEGLSRNLLMKGIPEIDKDNVELKIMVGKILKKLRFELDMTYIDCFRIGKKTEDRSRPVVVCLSSTGLKNVVLRDKRSTKISCANFSSEGRPWGPTEDLIYFDEHLTKENHTIYMAARKLKKHGFKYVWTRNGRIFVKYDEDSKVLWIDSPGTLNKLFQEVDEYEKRKEKANQNEDVNVDEVNKENEVMSEGTETVDEEVVEVDPPEEQGNKRKINSPPDQVTQGGRKRNKSKRQH